MAKTSKEFLNGLAALAEGLRRQIDADLEGWDVSPGSIAERRRKVCDPVSGFEFWDRNYFPHYGKAAPSALHQYLYKRLPEMVNTPSGQRDALAAPRGEAKSTKVSMSFVLWCVVTGAKWYAVIVMDAFEQAAEMLEAIKAELEAKGIHIIPLTDEEMATVADTLREKVWPWCAEQYGQEFMDGLLADING